MFSGETPIWTALALIKEQYSYTDMYGDVFFGLGFGAIYSSSEIISLCSDDDAVDAGGGVFEAESFAGREVVFLGRDISTKWRPSGFQISIFVTFHFPPNLSLTISAHLIDVVGAGFGELVLGPTLTLA